MISETGGKKPFVLKARSTGRVLGRHKTRASAQRQERAIQANKRRVVGRA